MAEEFNLLSNDPEYLREHARDLLVQVIALRQRIGSLENPHEDTSLPQSIQELRARIQVLEQEKALLQARVYVVDTMNGNLAIRVENLEADNLNLHTDNLSIKADNISIKADNISIKAQLQEVSDSIVSDKLNLLKRQCVRSCEKRIIHMLSPYGGHTFNNAHKSAFPEHGKAPHFKMTKEQKKLYLTLLDKYFKVGTNETVLKAFSKALSTFIIDAKVDGNIIAHPKLGSKVLKKEVDVEFLKNMEIVVPKEFPKSWKEFVEVAKIIADDCEDTDLLSEPEY